jgi:hypothetical protein
MIYHRDSIDILKPMKLVLRPEESGNGLYVFHAVSDDKLVAVITVDREHASVYPEYRLPKWATRQLAQAALDTMAKAAGEPAGDPADLRETKIKPAHWPSDPPMITPDSLRDCMDRGTDRRSFLRRAPGPQGEASAGVRTLPIHHSSPRMARTEAGRGHL